MRLLTEFQNLSEVIETIIGIKSQNKGFWLASLANTVPRTLLATSPTTLPSRV